MSSITAAVPGLARPINPVARALYAQLEAMAIERAAIVKAYAAANRAPETADATMPPPAAPQRSRMTAAQQRAQRRRIATRKATMARRAAEAEAKPKHRLAAA